MVKEKLTEFDLFQQIANTTSAILGVIEKLQKSSAEQEFIDIDAVGKLLGVTKRTIDGWRAQGIIGNTKIGGRVFFKRSEIKEVLEKNFSRKENLV